MKRTTLLPLLLPAGLILFVLLLATVWGQFSGPVNVTPVDSPPSVIRIVAANSPGWMKQGSNVWVCTGDGITTGDTAKIRAALAKAGDWDGDGVAEAGEGIPVHVAPGYYHLDMPAGETVWEGVATAAPVGNSTVLTVTSWAGTYTIADVRIGELVRLYAETDDPATLDDDLVWTVTDTDAKTTITLNGLLNGTYAAGIGFKRVVGALSIPSQVDFQCSGISSSYFRMMDDADCTGIVIEGYGDGSSGIKARISQRLAGFQLRKKTAAVAEDRDRNGIVVSAGTLDLSMESVVVQTIPGDGLTLNNGHACVLYGQGGVEGAWGHGVVLNPGHELRMTDWIVEANHRQGVLMHRTARASIAFNGAITETGVYGLKMRNCYDNVIHDCVLDIGSDTDPAGAINLIGSYNNSFTANLITGSAASDIGITMDASTSRNVLTGNQVHMTGANAAAVSLAGYWNTIIGNYLHSTGSGGAAFLRGTNYGINEIRGNHGSKHSDEVAITQMTNRSGGSVTGGYFVQRPTGYTTDGDEVNLATFATIARFLGCMPFTTADTVAGTVQLYGFNSAAAINSAEAAGQAVAVKDLLTVSATVPGTLVEAASTETVVAIALEAQTGNAGVVFKDMLLLRPNERFAAP